jgi:transcriptional regulator with XRE-family HTH domain/sRNA-binding regulator protein Hfq
MSNDLWELRKRRNLTVKQLAAKSGVPAKNIYAYENGEQVKIADLEKLAKALFVDKAQIKFQSDPIPKEKPAPPPPPRPPKPPQTARPPQPAEAPQTPQAESDTPPPAPRKGKQRKSPPQPGPATEGQLDHLRSLVRKLGGEETAVVERIGTPLEELTFGEARIWLKTFDQEAKAQKSRQLGERPPGTRRYRSHVPEQVDEFEINYLQTRQDAGDEISFTLLDETVLNGRIIGFSPYCIIIQQADGVETAIYKLALAYYQVASNTTAEEAA